MAERATPLDGKPSERATPIRRPRADQARLVADVLRHQIHAGGYPDGLPPEADLATDFFVSRNAVREALATLKDEGLIDRGPRVGTHVAIRKYAKLVGSAAEGAVAR